MRAKRDMAILLVVAAQVFIVFNKKYLIDCGISLKNVPPTPESEAYKVHCSL